MPLTSSSRTAGRLPGASLLLALPALLFYLPDWAARLQFDRGAAAHGEVWRLVTCHWTHWSPDHLLWDLAAFVLLAAICESWGPQGRKALLAAVAASALAIPVVLWIAVPAMERYRGLSGIDSALFVLAAVLVFRGEIEPIGRIGRIGRMAAVLAIAGFLGKAAWESATGTTLFTDSAGSFVPAPLAHLVGGVCGLWAGSRSRSDYSPTPAGRSA